MKSQILKEAMKIIPEHGFSLDTLQKAILNLNISTGIIGRVQPIDLVVYHQKNLISHLKEHDGSFYEKVSSKFRSRSDLMKPYSKHWIEATKILAQHPKEASQILQEQCHAILYASGDQSVDLNWYLRYGCLSQFIVASDLYLTQDKTDEYKATDKLNTDLMRRFFELDRTSSKIYLKSRMAFDSISKFLF
eukprot:NODE_469_length_7049_cov_0.468489.p7 type:complete len:191 gc:universal NODE_469_length_7049_cov_0.468489:3671-4243(+)